MKKLISCLLVISLILLTGCRQSTDNKGSDVINDNNSVDVLNTEVSADWPIYQSPEALVDVSKHIFEGKVIDISFYARRSGSVCNLFTIYEVAVIHTYKGTTNETEYIAMLGGIKDFREQEQQLALEEEYGFNSSVGIPLVRGATIPQIGSTYLFCTKEWYEHYIGGINPSQFALSDDSSITPGKIIAYIQENQE